MEISIRPPQAGQNLGKFQRFNALGASMVTISAARFKTAATMIAQFPFLIYDLNYSIQAAIFQVG